MNGLSIAALSYLELHGITCDEWVAAHGVRGAWAGDRCGCPDDRCIGHHHDVYDDCGCLQTLAENHITARARL